MVQTSVTTNNPQTPREQIEMAVVYDSIIENDYGMDYETKQPKCEGFGERSTSRIIYWYSENAVSWQNR